MEHTTIVSSQAAGSAAADGFWSAISSMNGIQLIMVAIIISVIGDAIAKIVRAYRRCD